MSDELVFEACINCKNYILGLCLQLGHSVEDDDRCGAWERFEQVEATPTAIRPLGRRSERD